MLRILTALVVALACLSALAEEAPATQPRRLSADGQELPAAGERKFTDQVWLAGRNLGALPEEVSAKVISKAKATPPDAAVGTRFAACKAEWAIPGGIPGAPADGLWLVVENGRVRAMVWIWAKLPPSLAKQHAAGVERLAANPKLAAELVTTTTGGPALLTIGVRPGVWKAMHAGWPANIQAAVLEGKIAAGMTIEQAEAAMERLGKPSVERDKDGIKRIMWDQHMERTTRVVPVGFGRPGNVRHFEVWRQTTTCSVSDGRIVGVDVTNSRPNGGSETIK